MISVKMFGNFSKFMIFGEKSGDFHIFGICQVFSIFSLYFPSRIFPNFVQFLSNYLQEKGKFMKDELERKRGRNGDTVRDGTLSYEELSIFYKKFLEDRQAKHVKYSW